MNRLLGTRPSGAISGAFALAACIVAAGAALCTGLDRTSEAQPDASRSCSGGDTWSIVAVDPATGDVGVAAATCLHKNITALAALVPGKGAAAVQAEFDARNRDAVLRRLENGDRATDIVRAVTRSEHDPAARTRQYGVVTLHDDGPVTAGFSGDGISLWSGRSDSVAHAVTVQGNFLHADAVVHNALQAFVTAQGAGVVLSDRLLRALEAGSAAGGDRRCNDNGVTQTNMTAFISVARPGQPPFAARDLGDGETDHPEFPWLHLSVTEDEHGPNPIVDLRRHYDAWRAQNLPACPACRLLAIEVPPGGGDPLPPQPTVVGVWTDAPEPAPVVTPSPPPRSPRSPAPSSSLTGGPADAAPPTAPPTRPEFGPSPGGRLALLGAAAAGVLLLATGILLRRRS